MRALVTGSRGFVGLWLTGELKSAGHEVVDVPQFDVTDRAAVYEALAEARPDAVVHLAATAYAPDAASNPENAYSIAVGGTINLLEASRRLPKAPTVLVAGSGEVYGSPEPAMLPLTETSAIAPSSTYALSKAAQESVALAYAARYGGTVVVTRSFSHTGPGQRPVFVVPALAQRIRAVTLGEAPDVPVGNVDVRRDISDVRDVVRAYRLLLEAGAVGGIPSHGAVVNVCSGQPVSIRWIIEELGKLAGIQPRLRVDPRLVREGEAPVTFGDPGEIERLVGWRVAIPLTKTLADMWASTSELAATVSH